MHQYMYGFPAIHITYGYTADDTQQLGVYTELMHFDE